LLADRKAYEGILEAVRHGWFSHPETMKISALRFAGSLY